MTYSSFGYGMYNRKVKEWIEEVRKEGVLVIDELDKVKITV